MPYLLGTDEAGYGPNLGPLVISTTVWRVDSINDTDLFSKLRGPVRSVDDEGVDEHDVVIGDSKDLYKPGKGLERLEQGVLTCLAAVKKRPRSWKRIWQLLAKEDMESLEQIPWYRDFDGELPIDLPAHVIRGRSVRFMSQCEKARCVPTQVSSRVVFAHGFNQLVEQHGNKASALSRSTLGLVRQVLSELPEDEPAYVVCDKHGGRNRYGPLLSEFFPDTLAMVRRESREESAYQMGNGHQRREIVFRAKADEAFLPSALASMVSKYLRELAMRAFNQFWTSRVEGLRPTAGYPLDAKRFKQQIAPTQRLLGIDDQTLWRCR